MPIAWDFKLTTNPKIVILDQLKDYCKHDQHDQEKNEKQNFYTSESSSEWVRDCCVALSSLWGEYISANKVSRNQFLGQKSR